MIASTLNLFLTCQLIFYVLVWSSRENKRPLSLGTTSSKVVMTSRYDLMTPDRAMTSRHLAITSSVLMMTSASVPGVTMLSTQINKVLWTSSPFLMLPRTSVTSKFQTFRRIFVDALIELKRFRRNHFCVVKYMSE